MRREGPIFLFETDWQQLIFHRGSQLPWFWSCLDSEPQNLRSPFVREEACTPNVNRERRGCGNHLQIRLYGFKLFSTHFAEKLHCDVEPFRAGPAKVERRPLQGKEQLAHSLSDLLGDFNRDEGAHGSPSARCRGMQQSAPQHVERSLGGLAPNHLAFSPIAPLQHVGLLRACKREIDEPHGFLSGASARTCD